MHCAIDFGTSNSAIALPPGNAATEGVRLVELEPGFSTMPTAVFYSVEGLQPHDATQCHFGRAAMRAYVDRHEGRLMRSMKSILGSALATQSTDIGAGRSVAYLDVVSGYLHRLKHLAEQVAGAELRRTVIGRPVFFVDDDPVRDAQAQQALAQAARNVGFDEVHFQYEPIAAALDYEQSTTDEQVVLVADIGGGTSDFSLVRVGPTRRTRVNRRDDILASHGVHVAGTDFDRHLALRCILPVCGYGALGPTGREVPSRVYFDLATWHLINTVYTPARVQELRRMRDFYADADLHRRLMTVLTQRLGHHLITNAESAKIEVATHGHAVIDLGLIESGIERHVNNAAAIEALDADMRRIDLAAQETLRLSGLRPADVDVLYFTGGSTGFTPLTDRLATRFASSTVIRGHRFASVAQGLGLHAARLFA